MRERACRRRRTVRAARPARLRGRQCRLALRAAQRRVLPAARRTARRAAGALSRRRLQSTPSGRETWIERPWRRAIQRRGCAGARRRCAERVANARDGGENGRSGREEICPGGKIRRESTRRQLRWLRATRAWRSNAATPATSPATARALARRVLLVLLRRGIDRPRFRQAPRLGVGFAVGPLPGG